MIPVLFRYMLPANVSCWVTFATGSCGTPETVSYDDFPVLEEYRSL